MLVVIVLLFIGLSNGLVEVSRNGRNITRAGFASRRDVRFFSRHDYVGPLYLPRLNDTNTMNQLKNLTLVNHGYYNVKNCHQWNPYVQELASEPLILSFLKPILGHSVFLWGTQLITQNPYSMHPWHVDIEHAHNITGVTVWICLETQSSIPKIKLISHSASVPYSPQQVGDREGKQMRGNSTRMEDISREFNEKSKLISITPRIAEMVIWKGRVWHHTINHSPGHRMSIILQYCSNTGNVDTDVPKVPSSFNFPSNLWHDTKKFRHFPFPISIE